MSKTPQRTNVRYWGFVAFLLLVAVYLISGLARLQLNNSEDYLSVAEDRRTKTIYLRGKRGKIVDADSVILAEDQRIYNVTFYKDASRRSKADYAAFTKSIWETLQIIEKNGNDLSIKFVIERDPSGEQWMFNFGTGVSQSVLATRESQWRRNNYLPATRYPTADSCMERLTALYQIDPAWSEETMLKIMAVYSEMQMNVFNSQPIVIARDVKYETMIEIETRAMLLPGMEIAAGTKRHYPRATLAAQVIGYTGAIPSAAVWSDLKTKGYSYNDTIGRDGIESSMEDWLTQNSSLRQGSRVVERDNLSKIVRELSYTEPQDGNNVKLTLVSHYQQAAERFIADNVAHTRKIQEDKMVTDAWLEKNKGDIATRNWINYPLKLAEHGCLIVLDMQDRVLAMANYPTYDLNALVAGGDEAIEILSDKRNLLLNYGIHARGTPGSIFKMVTGTGALADGKLLPTELISDQGYFTKYNQDKSTAPKCWISPKSAYKHANQTIVEGIVNSCNYFFYTIGDKLGEQRLYHYAYLFGLTSRTGIDLPGEVRSVVGSQNTLYDPSKPMNEASQDTSLPIIVFNAIKKHLRNSGASRNLTYDDEKLSVCAKRLMDMAVNYPESVWVENMRTILMEELNMSKEMVYLQSVIGDTYNYMNTVKWGGAQTILTAVGQSVTVLTPVAVARYVAALANGGLVYNVSLVDSITSPNGEIMSQREPQLINTIEGGEQWLKYIQQGMEGVVDDGGTARRHFRNFKYSTNMAAKTGTAETTSIDLENNAWFVAFTPFENPEIAIVSFIPNGYSGAEAAPAARDFIEYYLDQQVLRTTDFVLPGGNHLAP